MVIGEFYVNKVSFYDVEDGQYMPKYVVVLRIVIKYTLCDTVMFNWIIFAKFHKQRGWHSSLITLKLRKTNVMQSELCRLFRKTQKHSGRPQLAEQRHFLSFRLQLKSRDWSRHSDVTEVWLSQFCVVVKRQYRLKNVCYSNPITGPDRHGGFEEFEVPRFQDNLHMEVVRLSVQQTGRLYLREIFPVNISVRRSQPRAILRP